MHGPVAAGPWQRVRTNNPLERLIRTLRMRLDPMGCFHDEPAVQRAVFGQLARRRFLGIYAQSLTPSVVRFLLKKPALW